MKVVFLKDYSANAYIDGSDPKNASIRYIPIPTLFFTSGSKIDIDEVKNYDESTSYVYTHLNGKYLIDKDAVEEKQEKVNLLIVALLAGIVGGGIYLMFKK